MVRARTAELPAEVAERGKHHILDTIAAMVSGSTLHVGHEALRYARAMQGGDHASVVGMAGTTNVVFAALSNGMLAHADETDDSHAAAGMHPGCAILPAALAMAEKNHHGGAQLLRAVVLGYDVGARTMRAVGADLTDVNRRFDTHAFGGVFGAAAAGGACTVEPLDETQQRWLLSYAAQQASGMASYPMDSFHVEKAYIFGGIPARGGAFAATMIEAGFTGIHDDLEGYNGFLHSYGTPKADASELAAELGERFEILRTNIKRYSVGSPIQAPVDCVANLMRDHGVGAADLARMVVYTPRGEDKITRADQSMSNLNIRYLLAVTMLDGGYLGFTAAHDEERVHQPEIGEIAAKISIEANPALHTPESPRQGIVEFHTHDGRVLTEHVVKVRGVMENPMTTDEVVVKARDLLETALPAAEADRIISLVLGLEDLDDVGELTHLLRAS